MANRREVSHSKVRHLALQLLCEKLLFVSVGDFLWKQIPALMQITELRRDGCNKTGLLEYPLQGDETAAERKVNLFFRVENIDCFQKSKQIPPGQLAVPFLYLSWQLVLHLLSLFAFLCFSSEHFASLPVSQCVVVWSAGTPSDDLICPADWGWIMFETSSSISTFVSSEFLYQDTVVGKIEKGW